MNRFIVWSEQIGDDEQPAGQVREVTRSDRRVAEEDAALIRWVGHRKSWVQDSEES